MSAINKEAFIKRINVSSGKEVADVVIRNGRIVDVFNAEITEGDIAIVDGMIVGIGEYDGHNVIDAGQRYVCPAFIDGHVHIESAMVTPTEFAKVLLSHGVTTVIADPHEIANVSGTEGIHYMLEASEGLPFDFYFMLPSSVPATAYEHSGAELNITDLAPFYSHPRVLGLAEVMNYPAVRNAQDDMIDKLLYTIQKGAKIDGHAAGLNAMDINVYMAASIRNDHECVTAEEAKERLRRGMYVMIREGTVAKNLGELVKAVSPQNARRCLFVTDDKHLDDLIEEGSIDHNVRLAIKAGVDPLTAIQMATLNTAECFALKQKGAVAPGYDADFLLLDSLDDIRINQVYKQGKLVANEGKVVEGAFQAGTLRTNENVVNSVSLPELTNESFRLALNKPKANIIGIVPNSLVTEHLIDEVDVRDGYFMPSTEKDLLKIAVIERHHLTNYIGIGIINGLGIKSGAIATTIAHDSHNLIVAGTNDADMLFAAKLIEQMQGGLVVVKEQKMLAGLHLPIAGLMSEAPYSEVNDKLADIHQALKQLEADSSFNPFLTLSFMALPVIPSLKITDMGLFDVKAFKHIAIEA